MAFTIAVIDRYNEANKRVHVLSCTADAATQAIDTGLTVVDHFLLTPQSMTTAAGKFYANTDASGTASNGYIGCSGVANGDVFYLKVYGR